ncbi:MAG: TetR/AcrR family transcriptional regulator [Actinomycetota bacterium]
MARIDLTDIRRRQIIDAAFKVFAENGYHNSTMADIATELDVGHGTLYRYFKNKLDIAACVLEDIIDRISLIVTDLPPESVNSLDEYAERLDEIGDRFFGLLEDNPDMHRFLFYEALAIDDSVTRKINAAFLLFGSYTEMYLRNGIDKGFLKPDIHTHEASLAINAMLFEASRRLSGTGEIDEESKRAWSDTIKRFIIEGFGK